MKQFEKQVVASDDLGEKLGKEKKLLDEKLGDETATPGRGGGEGQAPAEAEGQA